MEIKVGDYEVLESGVVTSVNSGDILFKLSDSVRVRLKFIDIDDDKENMTAVVNNVGELEISLSGFKNPLGTEFTKEAEIGHFKGKKLYLHVRVLGIKSTNNRVVFHTWYLGGNISNG